MTGRSTEDTTLANLLRILLAGAGWLLCSAMWLGMLAWLAGVVLMDRYAWSQWLWWTPTLAAIAMATLGVFGAARPVLRGSRRKRRRRIVIWMVVLFATVSYFCIEHRVWRTDQEPDRGVRIAHWNLRHPPPRNYAAFLEGVRRVSGDIVVFSSSSGVLRSDAAEGVIPNGFAFRTYGIFSVLTRFPILGDSLLLHDDDYRVWLVEFDTTAPLGRPVVMYIVDLPSEIERGRMAIAGRLRRLLDKRDAPAPDLVVGDFNMTRSSASIDRLFPEHRNAYNDAGHGYAATFPREFPLFHIDHILLDGSLEATDYDVIDPGVGSHRAQAATIVARPR